MPQEKFITREPVLNPKHQIAGYRLSLCHGQTGAPAQGDADLGGLAGFVAGQLNDPESGWQMRDQLLFLDATPSLLASDEVQGLHPANTVLMLTGAERADGQTPGALKSLRAQGYRIALRHVDAVTAPALLPYATHIELPGAAEAAAKAKTLAPGLRVLVAQVRDWKEYDACTGQGMDVCAGRVCLTARPETKPKGLNAAQGIILQLLDLVRKNADVRELEAVMKRDAALSYKLFRYINSVGFGLGAEIQSLRHAVTMLGYSTLYRWLTLLLATASVGNHSAALMQTAIIRGRFAELLGKGLLSKNETGNLFVAGMFSLLDRLLGIPMSEVLEHIQLPDDISEALLERTGMYGPFLALAEACESGGDAAGPFADALLIDPAQVNEAHLAALAWAQSLEI